jgi:hypothetical protein
MTLNASSLTDLIASGQVPKYKKGLWKVPISAQLNEPDFQWESWDAPTADAVRAHMLKVAETDPLTKQDAADWLEKAAKTDYTVPGVLDEINERDLATKERLDFALEFFAKQEALSKEFVEGVLKQYL